MKALLIGSLFAIILIIAGTLALVIFDSSNTIDSSVSSEKKTALVTAETEDTKTDTTTSTSAKEALAELKNNQSVQEDSTTKTGYSWTYQAQQNENSCSSLIVFKEDDFNEAEEEYEDVKEEYEKAQQRLNELEDADAIEEAQEEIKEQKEELENAEQAMFNAKEELIKARTTCQG